VARLVENGLHDNDRYKRASALEALESLSERRFTRLFFPILEVDGHRDGAWRDVAQRQWHLTLADVPTALNTCLASPNKWIVIGALISAQARAAAMGPAWTERLTEFASTAADAEIRGTARRLLGMEATDPHRSLSLTDVMLIFQRSLLFSSTTLEQRYTIARSMTEHEMLPGEVIFHEGDLNQELYLIVSGKVDIVQKRGVAMHTIATLSAGEFFGEMANFEDRPRSASAVAVGHGVLLVLSSERFRQIILQDPAISFEIFRVLCARIRRFDTEAMEVAR
jgi:hypothetical protein